MPNTLTLTDDAYEDLLKHLLQNGREQVAFAFAEALTDGGGVDFQVKDLYLVPPEGLLIQQSYHVSLTDEAQVRIIKAAWEKKLALVEFHSHRGDEWPAQFSPSDLHGLREFVPHVRWRLRGQPYLAVVVGSSDFDGLVWRDGAPESLEGVRIGDRVLMPTGLTLRALGEAV